MQFFENYSLKKHHTFAMEVSCERFVVLEHPEEVREVVERGWLRGDFFILGGGSNVLFTKHFHGTILHPAFKAMEVVAEDEQTLQLRVAAGEEWSTLTDYCLQHQLYGLENLTGIPGCVGSAPVQNIGAYGVEVKDCIVSVEGVRLDTLQPFVLDNSACHFGYRDSIFKQSLRNIALITHVSFRLSKLPRFNLTYKALSTALAEAHAEPTLEHVARTVVAVRNSKLPDITQIGCAGSFFKNPLVSMAQFEALQQRIPDLVSYPAGEGQVKLAAGQLIDKAGWKGKQIGQAGIYPKQALVVVNYGGASPDEVCRVYQSVIQDVKEKFHILLQPEVNIL